MKSLTPNKTRSQAQVALNSGFFWTNNKPIEFEKHTIKNGIPFIEKHKGIILWPKNDFEEIYSTIPKINSTKKLSKKDIKEAISLLQKEKVKTVGGVYIRNNESRKRLINFGITAV